AQEPGPESIQHKSYTTPGGQGGPLREVGRAARDWLTTPVRRPYGRGAEVGNRQGRLTVNTKGDVVLTIGTLTILYGSLGAAVAGPVGAAIGAAIPGGVATLMHLSRSGETIDIDPSRLALAYAQAAARANPIEQEYNRMVHGTDFR